MGQLKQIIPIPFTNGDASERPVTIDIPQPIVGFYINMLLNIVTDDTGGTVVTIADGVKRFLRQFQILRGDEPMQTWGRNNAQGAAGIMLEILNRTWLQSVPAVVDPDGLLAVAGTAVADGPHTVELRYFVPFSLPRNRYSRQRVNQSALRIASETWQAQAIWGTAADVVALTGTATAVVTVASTELKVAAEIDIDLDKLWPQGNLDETAGILLKTVPLSEVIAATANSDQEEELSKVGDVLFHGVAAYDVGLLDDDIINRLTYIINDDVEVVRADWEIFQSQAEYEGDNPNVTGLPAGMNAINFDTSYDLTGRVQTALANGWKVRINGNGATPPSPLTQQVMYIQRFIRQNNMLKTNR